MRTILYLTCAFLLYGCGKVSNQSEELIMGNDDLNSLKAMFPNVEFELISESHNHLEYFADGEKIKIEELDNKVIISIQDKIIHMNFNDTNTTIKDELLSGNLSSNDKDLLSIEIYNENNELIEFGENIGSNNQDIPFANAEGCTSPNVFDCIANHCEDAGAIACGVCALSKYCIAGVTAWCTVEVQFEIENPLHCD